MRPGGVPFPLPVRHRRGRSTPLLPGRDPLGQSAGVHVGRCPGGLLGFLQVPPGVPQPAVQVVELVIDLRQIAPAPTPGPRG